MSRFQAVFVQLHGVEHRDVGNPVCLAAQTRADALEEALGLRVPPRADFIEVTSQGKAVGWLTVR